MVSSYFQEIQMNAFRNKDKNSISAKKKIGMNNLKIWKLATITRNSIFLFHHLRMCFKRINQTVFKLWFIIKARFYLLFFAAVIWKPVPIIIPLTQNFIVCFLSAVMRKPNYNSNSDNWRKTLSFALGSSMLARFRIFRL